MNLDYLTSRVLCYADDILLASLTSTGLQSMINLASKYITEHGLTFNATKTECSVFGKCTLLPKPCWYMDNIRLKEVPFVKYLGVHLSSQIPGIHVEKRIKACRNAFFALKGTGLCDKSSTPDTTAYVWNTAVRSVLTYGLQCVPLSTTSLAELESLQ